MRRGWVRDRLLVVVGAALIVVAVVWAVRLYLLPAAQRDGVLQYAAFVVALVGAVITVWDRLRDVRGQVDPRPVDILAELLAQAVLGQWRKEAVERVLVTPAPIPIRWSVSDLPVAGPVEAAVGDLEVAPAFPPLPGQVWVTERQVRDGGGGVSCSRYMPGLARVGWWWLARRGRGRAGPGCCWCSTL